MERSNAGGFGVARQKTQIAIARAAGARSVAENILTAFNNRQQSIQAGPSAPAQAVHITAILTPEVSGNVALSGSISGALSAIDLPVTVQYFRGATPIGPIITVPGGHAAAPEQSFGCTMPDWIDIQQAGAIGTPQTYTIRATTSGGQTITVPDAGGSLTVVEQPG